PFLGYLRTLSAGSLRAPASTTLIYATRDRAFDAELKSLRIANFVYTCVTSGRNMGALLERVDPGTRAFLCGSKPFMQTTRRALVAAGIDNQSIQEEHFTPHAPVTE